MPLVTNFHITPEEEELFYKSCTKRESFYGTKIDKKDIVYRTRNFADLIAQSQFPDVATAWNSLSNYEKGLWTYAGYWADKSGWDLFAQDMAYRISNAIAGIGEPNIYHQFKVGWIHIEAPASSIIIRQNISVPANPTVEFSINFCNLLVPTSGTYYATFSLYFYSDYWDPGELWEEGLYIDEGDRWAWNNDVYYLSDMDPYGFYLTIEVYNMRGDLYIDGIECVVNDVNLVNDWQCDIIESSWVPVSVPAGASFASVYSRNSFYNYY